MKLSEIKAAFAEELAKAFDKNQEEINKKIKEIVELKDDKDDLNVEDDTLSIKIKELEESNKMLKNELEEKNKKITEFQRTADIVKDGNSLKDEKVSEALENAPF